MRFERLYLLYLSVAMVRSANAVFIVSIALTYPGLSAAAVGQLLAVYSIVEALSGFLCGVVYELLGPRITLLVSSSMLAASYLAMNTTSNFQGLIVFNAVAGLSASMILVSSLSAIAEGTRGASTTRRIFGVGGFEASNLGGYAVGFALAGSLELLGMLRGFIVSFILASLSALASIYAPPAIGGRNTRAEIFHIDRRAIMLVPMWFGLAMILGVGFLSPKILREMGLGISIPMLGDVGGGPLEALGGAGSNPSVGLLLIVVLLGAALGIMAGSMISSKVGKERSLALGAVSFPAALIIIGYTYRDLLTYLPLIIVVAVPALSVPPTLLALLADYTDEGVRRGPSSGIYVTVLGIGIGFGEIAGGRIFDLYGLGTLAFLLAIAFSALSLPTVIYVNRSRLSTRRGGASHVGEDSLL